MDVCPLTRIGWCMLVNAVLIFRSRIRNTILRLVSKYFWRDRSAQGRIQAIQPSLTPKGESNWQGYLEECNGAQHLRRFNLEKRAFPNFSRLHEF